MTSRRCTAMAAAVVMLIGTACGTAPAPESAPAEGLGSWAADNVPPPAEGGFSMAGVTGPDGDRSSASISDVEPGWYAVTMACEATEPGEAPVDPSARIVLSGERGTYGEGDCVPSPVTTTTRLGASDEASPEAITVEAEADGHEFYWGVSASPTTAPG